MPHTIDETGVERVDSSEFGVVARVLVDAFANDPVFVWAMPRAATRQEDATAFFTFYLRRRRAAGQEVFATPDRSAVAVITEVRASDRMPREDPVELPRLLHATSPAADYFHWIKTFQPGIDHRYLEFIGSSSTCRTKGQGSRLLKSLLATAAREGLPVWTWSSNPRNLSFYQRLDFEAGADLCRDADTPAVTPLLRPPVPVAL